jgi:hypothetical protein
MTVLALIISILSLLVSFAALYISHLRSSRIELDGTNLENDTDTRMLGGWNGVWPTPGFVIYYKFYIQNLGNKTGSFEGIKTVLTPASFNNFSLVVNTTLSTDTTDQNGHYKSMGERLPVPGGSVIPVMLGISFRINDGTNFDDKQSFLSLWNELKKLQKRKEPHLQIDYIVKELNMFGNAKSKTEPITYAHIADRVIQVLVGHMAEIGQGHRDYELVQQCLHNNKH